MNKMSMETKVDLTPMEEEIFKLFSETAQEKEITVRIAGGWVRDKIMRRASDDIDVALDKCSGREFAESVATVLQKYGHTSGTIATIAANPDQSKHLETATMKIFNLDIDFVNLRSEAYADDSRIPSISFGTAKEDAYRRDFTINSLFYNLNTSSIEDLTGYGISDLQQHILRTPLDPFVTFKDDPLRLLRGIRFAARFNFQLHPSIETAALYFEKELPPTILSSSSLQHEALNVSSSYSSTLKQALLTKVSRERVFKELDGMLLSTSDKQCRPVVALGLMHRLNIFDCVFINPESNTAVIVSPTVDGISLPSDMSNWKTISLSIIFTTSVLVALYSSSASSSSPHICIRLGSTTASPCNLHTPASDISLSEDSIITPFPSGINYRHLMLSASVFGLGHFFITEKKKQVSLAIVSLRDGLKADNEATRHTSILLDCWALFMKYSIRGCSRVEGGLLLRRCQSMWRECLLLACAAELASASHWDPSGYVSSSGVVSKYTFDTVTISILHRYCSLQDYIEHSLHLDQCWTVPPMMDGNALINMLNMKKGPSVGQAMEEQVRWMLEYPNGDQKDLLVHLLAFVKGLE